MDRAAFRWVAVAVIVGSSLLNYLDRSLLAAAAPSIRSEFGLSNTDYGRINSAFSLVYAFAAPFAGLLLDAIGLNLGVSAAVAVWSLASSATAAAMSLPLLVACRMLLGIAEAAGIPSTGKTFATYLAPKEVALGTASNSIGVSLGAILAPLVMGAIAPVWGWRSAFLVCGGLGFVWIPIWWWTVRKAPKTPAQATAPVPLGGMLRDRRLYGLAFTNVFIMMLFTLWAAWTTVYFVDQRHLTQTEANRYFVWIPPVFGALGGFAGGWIMLVWIRGGLPTVRARVRLAGLAAIVLPLSALVPQMPSAGAAAVAISLSCFFTMALSVAVYALPLDLFGPGRAGFSIAALTCALGLMQAVLSPWIGWMADLGRFNQVCVLLAFTPLIGYGILRLSLASELR